MDTQKAQIIDRLGQATNILVTVSANPSVDQLACTIGLTLLLNKLGKHATAVFSGEVPSTVQFLQPEKTLEKNTDSLRDFIIALDKSKADKLRYKVEDQMVKIFITPYRTSISENDLEYSQGDFNVEVVIALGVKEQKDLDEAIIAHGRILHDATVIGIDTKEGLNLGSINWVRTESSSLCEMGAELGVDLKPDILDGQISTAFLTGVVAETERFSNEKTSASTMQLSAKLMAAGADPQLVASQLKPMEGDLATVTSDGPTLDLPGAFDDIPKKKPAKPQADDGAIEIEHGDNQAPELPEELDEEDAEEAAGQINIDGIGELNLEGENPALDDQSVESEPPELELPNPVESESQDESPNEPRLVLDPPTLGGRLTANSEPEALDPSTDPLGITSQQGPILTHTTDSDGFKPSPDESKDTFQTPSVEDIVGSTSTLDEPTTPASEPLTDNTLADLEKKVESPHVNLEEANLDLPQSPDPLANDNLSLPGETKDTPGEETPIPVEPISHTDVNAARDAVQQAMKGDALQNLEPVQALNAQPMDLNLGDMPAVNTSPESAFADFHPTDFTPVTNAKSVPDSELPVTPMYSDPGLLSPQLTDDSKPSSMPPDLTAPPSQITLDPALPLSDNSASSAQSPMPPPPVPPPMMPPMMSPVVPPPDDADNPANKAL